MVILTGLLAKAETILNSSTRPKSSIVGYRPSADRGGMENIRIVLRDRFGRVSPWKEGIFCQK